MSDGALKSPFETGTLLEAWSCACWHLCSKMTIRVAPKEFSDRDQAEEVDNRSKWEVRHGEAEVKPVL